MAFGAALAGLGDGLAAGQKLGGLVKKSLAQRSVKPEQAPAPVEDRSIVAGNDEEKQFQEGIRQTPWFSEFKKQYNEEPNLDDPDYDYRTAWKNGIRPEIYEHDGTYHWPSGFNDASGKSVSLKSDNHPTMWMEKFYQATGGRDPHEFGIKTPEEAERFLRKPQAREEMGLSMPMPRTEARPSRAAQGGLASEQSPSPWAGISTIVKKIVGGMNGRP